MAQAIVAGKDKAAKPKRLAAWRSPEAIAGLLAVLAFIVGWQVAS